MKKCFYTLILALGCTLNLQAQTVVRNLGFEDIDANGKIISWELGNTKKKYVINLDTSVAHSGKCSLMIAMPTDDSDRGFAGASSTILGSNIGTKKILRVSAFIKTENLSDGIVGIGLQLNGDNGPIKESNSNAQTKQGTTTWTKHTIELPLSNEVKFIKLGLQMTGKGKVWFDDFEISFDDAPVGNGILVN